jgi:ABC-type multidrug transport system permease subunit
LCNYVLVLPSLFRAQTLTSIVVQLFISSSAGLDSTMAFKVMSQVRGLVHASQLTCLTTIHQPSAQVFSLFDDVLLMAQGRLVYNGPVAAVADYFGGLGYPIPTGIGVNTADFIIAIVDVREGSDNHDDDDGGDVDDEKAGDANTAAAAAAVNSERDRQHAADEERCQALMDAYQVTVSSKRATVAVTVGQANAASDDTGVTVAGDNGSRYALSHFDQFRYLLRRSLTTQLRNKMLTKARLGQTLVLSFIVSLLYMDVGYSQNSIQDRQGMLFLVAVNQFIIAAVGVLFTFPAERALFVRERNDGLYSTRAYFAAKSLADVPFQLFFPTLFACIIYYAVGLQAVLTNFLLFIALTAITANIGAAIGFTVSGATGDVATALSIMPVSFLPLMLFSGFLVNLSSMTVVVKWISYIDPLRFTFSLYVINEFEGLTFECDVPSVEGTLAAGMTRGCVSNGEQVLDRLDVFDAGSKWEQFGYLMTLLIVFRVGGFVALWLSTRKIIA